MFIFTGLSGRSRFLLKIQIIVIQFDLIYAYHKWFYFPVEN